MSRLYGAIQGSRGPATRCGTDEIKVSAQSWEGSVIVRMTEAKNEAEPTVRVEISDGSSTYGDTVFRGTIAELKAKLQA